VLPAVLVQVSKGNSPVEERLKRLETSLLLGLLLLQWSGSLPAGSPDAQAVCSPAFLILSHALQAVKTEQTHSLVVLPAGAAPQAMLLPLSVLQQQFVVVPPTPIVAELLPLLVRLCQARLLLQGPQHTASASASSQAVTIPGAMDIACNLAILVVQLVQASHIGQAGGAVPRSAKDGPSAASCLGTSSSSAAAEASAAPPRSVLHSRDVFSAHAADTIATLESVVRIAVGTCPAWGWDAGAAQSTMAVVEEQAYAVALLARHAGPGSAGLQQYFSFLGTLLKIRAEPALLRDRLRLSAAGDATSWLESHETVLIGVCQQMQSAAAAAATVQQQQQQACAVQHSAAISLLASLMVIGRFFLLFVQPLQAAADPGQQQAQTVTHEQLQGLHISVAVAEAVQEFLQVNSTPLAAAGYPVDTLMQQLQQLLSDMQAFSASQQPQLGRGIHPANSTCVGQSATHAHTSSSSSSSSSTREVLSAALQQMRQTDLALCCMAVPYLCNNPGCTNNSGPTELSLVSGRSCVCGGCLVAHYCCRACQTQHWKQHKPVCKALAAAAAAGAAGSAAVHD
jgi:hypothetical protein